MQQTKIKVSLFFCFVLISFAAFSQNFNVQSAADSYKDLQYTKTGRLKDLSDAKKYIDLAAANEQTANDPKMWYYRGKVYLEIDRDTTDAIKNLDPDAIEKSASSFINCLKTDTKKNYYEDCSNQVWVAGIRLYNKGIRAMNGGEYEKASRYFNITAEIFPYDKDNNLKRNTITPDIINFYLSKTAIKAKDNAKAKVYLQKLIDGKYNDPMIYIYMDRIYQEEKDTAKALTYIAKGRDIFSENAALLNEEIVLYSRLGRYNDLITKFSEAIEQDPDKESMYYNRGSLYDSKGEYAKAETDYKKAIDLRPDYFEANYYLGVMDFNQAADLIKEANGIKNNDEFEKAKKKYEQKLKDAEPYLEKAQELNQQKSEDDKKLYKENLNLLKQLYSRTGEMDKYNKVKAQLDQK